MKVLVACEESQEVCKAFRALGHEAYSCDVEWREIPGFPNYEASSAGEIRSKERVVQYSDGRKRLYKPTVLSPTMSSGYKSVNLRNETGLYSKKVHFLVASAFLGQRPVGLDVRHKNGDRLDNRADNLEYGTRSENNLDGYRIRGYVTKLQKLSPSAAVEIVMKRNAGASQRSLAKEYGVSKSAIAAIMQGELYGWCTDEKRRNDFGRM